MARAHGRRSHSRRHRLARSVVAHGALAQFYSVPVALWAFYDGWSGGLAAAGLSSIAMFAAPGDVTVINRTIEFHCTAVLRAAARDRV